GSCRSRNMAPFAQTPLVYLRYDAVIAALHEVWRARPSILLIFRAREPFVQPLGRRDHRFGGGGGLLHIGAGKAVQRRVRRAIIELDPEWNFLVRQKRPRIDQADLVVA